MINSTKNKKITAILIFRISGILFFIGQDLLGKHLVFRGPTVYEQAIDDEYVFFYTDIHF